MTADEALQLFSRAAAASVADALRELGHEIEVEEPVVVEQGASPFADAPAPGIEAAVELDEGLTGESILLLSEAAAQLLAGGPGGDAEPAADDDEEAPDPLDAAAARVAVHVTAAVAATAGRVLGQDVPVGEPAVRRVASEAQAGSSVEKSANLFALSFTVDGEPARFVQSVQNAFLVKAAPGLDELAELSEAAANTGDAVPDAALRDVKVRVWAELGRAHLPLAQAVAIPSGAVVQLDRGADEPVELFVNGRLFAHGRLVVRDDEWAVEIEDLVGGLRRERETFVELTAAPEEPLEAAPASDPQPASAAADNPQR